MKKKTGLACASREVRIAVARSGGLALSKNKAHMSRAGSIGGLRVSEDREHMSRIGKLGGAAGRKNPQAKEKAPPMTSEQAASLWKRSVAFAVRRNCSYEAEDFAAYVSCEALSSGNYNPYLKWDWADYVRKKLGNKRTHLGRMQQAVLENTSRLDAGNRWLDRESGESFELYDERFENVIQEFEDRRIGENDSHFHVHLRRS